MKLCALKLHMNTEKVEDSKSDVMKQIRPFLEGAGYSKSEYEFHTSRIKAFRWTNRLGVEITEQEIHKMMPERVWTKACLDCGTVYHNYSIPRIIVQVEDSLRSKSSAKRRAVLAQNLIDRHKHNLCK